MADVSDSDESCCDLNLFPFDLESDGSLGESNQITDCSRGKGEEYESVNQIKISRAEMTHFEKEHGKKTLNYKNKWKQVASKLAKIQDPWHDFPQMEEKEVKRHRYNAETTKWTLDQIKIKMENKPFSRGSMRECFRLKCLTNFAKDWRNCVAKRYLDFATVETYKNDIIMQAVAKKWSELYNRSNPPKKIDMVQLNMIELPGGCEFYHIEPFMAGDYVKYNSNCGFVSNCMRNTPQTFSHFTFEKSGHSLMVVDIQGVDDLYTDPQIHTYDSDKYGEGNLGIRGMALFFQSHICSSICTSLGLQKFDLTETEINHNNDSHVLSSPQTMAFNDEREMSSNSECGSKDSHFSFSPYIRRFLGLNSGMCKLSECSNEEVENTHVLFRGSNLINEANMIKSNTDDEVSILSKIHHQLALYHQMGRFVDRSAEIDWKAYDFHENIAAQLDNPEAMENLAKIYLDLTTTDFNISEILSDQKSVEDLKPLGVKYIIRCADMFRSPFCLRHVAHCWMEGSGLYELSEKNWKRAADCLEVLITCGAGEYYESTHMHLFREKAELAKLYMTGGFGVNKRIDRAGQLFTEAANEALSTSYTQMAMSYFAFAEECQTDE